MIYIHGSLNCDGETFLLNLMGGTFFQAKESIDWHTTISSVRICSFPFGKRFYVEFDKNEYEKICTNNELVGFGMISCPPKEGFLLLKYFFHHCCIIENDPRLEFFKIYNIPVEIDQT